MCNINRIPFADLYWQRELLLLDGDSLTVTDMLLNYAEVEVLCTGKSNNKRSLRAKGDFTLFMPKCITDLRDAFWHF